MWPYMCMCCGLFAPHNSILHVVVSVTIQDNKKTNFIYIFVFFYKNVAKNMKPLWKVVQIVRYNWGLVFCLSLSLCLSVSLSLCLSVSLSVSVCVCVVVVLVVVVVVVEGGERERLIEPSGC